MKEPKTQESTTFGPAAGAVCAVKVHHAYASTHMTQEILGCKVHGLCGLVKASSEAPAPMPDIPMAISSCSSSVVAADMVQHVFLLAAGCGGDSIPGHLCLRNSHRSSRHAPSAASRRMRRRSGNQIRRTCGEKTAIWCC
jgi:hypothetical protein